jgi:probable HAF family extracellular repeat protein
VRWQSTSSPATGVIASVTPISGSTNGSGQVVTTVTAGSTPGQATVYAVSSDQASADNLLYATAAINVTSPPPTIVDLGTLAAPGGVATSEAHGINDLGQIAGYSTIIDNAEFHATLWASGTITNLGELPGGSRSFAVSINGNGDVVGTSETVVETGSHVFRATLWKGGTKTDLGTLATFFPNQGGGPDPDGRSGALGINDNGQIVGYTAVVGGSDNAFLWTPAQPGGTTGTMTNLGTLGGASSTASGISGDGQKIVGYSTIVGNQAFHAFLWQTGTGMGDLGTLPGGNSSFAYGISGNGQKIVGSSDAHAVLWENGTIADLGTLGGSYSVAYGVNDLGQIVGQSSTTDGATHAVLWDHGTITDLGTLGGSYGLAYGINGNGTKIVGQSAVPGDQVGHATLWTGF